MNRRELLLLKRDLNTRVVELTCASLYMQYLDTQRPSASVSALGDHWLGEPEPRWSSSSARELFDGLQRELASAEVLRLVEPRWLADPGLRREVDLLIARFRASGGRVEIR